MHTNDGMMISRREIDVINILALIRSLFFFLFPFDSRMQFNSENFNDADEAGSDGFELFMLIATYLIRLTVMNLYSGWISA